MGKPAKWFKNVLLGKKSSKSSSNVSKGYYEVTRTLSKQCDDHATSLNMWSLYQNRIFV